MRWREGTSLRYITARHRTEAHNGVLIKKSILGCAGLRNALQEKVQVGTLSEKIGKAILSATRE